MVVTRHTGHWTLTDLFASPWHYLPFEVPPGSCAIRAELEYQRSGAVLDLGCLGPAGFRGWSGAVRRSFVIASTMATPGYLPGEPEPGSWQLMIGLHRVPAHGCDYQVTIEISRTPGELAPDDARQQVPPHTDRPSPRELPTLPGRRWLAGDLHTHTVHSDGVLTVAELARFAAGRGMDFVAVTDHNTISHHAELRPAAATHGITLLPGQEVTTQGGHAGALGDIGWIDFREPPDYWLETCERTGGLLSVNHPYGGQLSWVTQMKRRPPLLEVWHWSWLDTRWTLPISWWQAWDPAAVPIGGSDWHRPGSDAPPGSPTTWVETEDTDPAAVLAALAAGRTAISASRDGPVLLRVGDELIASEADGAILVGPGGPRARVRGPLARFPAADGHHRLVDETDATLALTG